MATTLAITTMTTKQSGEKSQIRSMGTDKHISDLSSPMSLKVRNYIL